MSRIGKLPVSIPAGVTVDVKGNVVHVKGPKGELTQEMHKDMLIAVEDGHLVMNLGYSHQVIMDEIPGITIDVPAPNKIIISGPNKQMVGQFAAEVREKRPPEPYKGKGIKYATEVVRRKEGKAGGKKK